MGSIDGNGIYEEIKKTKKYARVCEAVVRRVCREESVKYEKKTERIKAVKKKLHAIYGAFLTDNDIKKMAAAFEETGIHEELFNGAVDLITGNEFLTDDELKHFSIELLKLHTSASERLKTLPEFYAFISEHAPGDRIIDLGCGFNPFAVAWMKPQPSAYLAVEIDTLAADFINRYFRALKLPARFECICMDLIAETPQADADTAFMMKLVPVLESQKAGRALEIMETLNAGRIVVTYPLKSIGGKEKGMGVNYARAFEEMTEKKFIIKNKAAIGEELVYVIARR